MRRAPHYTAGRVRRRAFQPALLTLALTALPLAACHTMEGEASMQLPAADYPRTFRACIEAGREQGMPPLLADRGNGIIETEPRDIGSLLEPWRTDHSGFEQVAQATLQFERRRVRFVFMPVGWEPEAIDGTSDFTGAAQPGSPQDTARFDLETWQGPVELRARVFVERNFTPGIRPSTWSGTLVTVTKEPPPPAARDGTDRTPTLWTPIGRDEAAERTLLSRVRALMAEETPAVTSGPTAAAPTS